MNPKAIAALAAAAVVGGAVVVFDRAPGDKGPDCVPVDVQCPVYTSFPSEDDAGWTGYATVGFRAIQCSDGGMEQLGQQGELDFYDLNQCSIHPVGQRTKPDGTSKKQTHLCACRKATGSCTVLELDGGRVDAQFGRNLKPYQSWSGAGCQDTACVEKLGISSWPAECPGGAP